MEIQLLRLEDRRKNTDVLTAVVTGLLEAKDLSEEILREHIPQLAKEDPAIALVTRIAYQELMRRYFGIRDDLEALAKMRARRGAPPTASLGRGGKVLIFRQRATGT